MRLFDQIVQASEPCRIVDERGVHDMPGSIDRAHAVRDLPLRYVLQPEVVARCRELLLSDRAMLDTRNALLRAPTEALWLEWKEDRRIGLLVSASACGRSGEIEVFWEDGATDPVLAQAMLQFDFERSLPPCEQPHCFPLLGYEHPLSDHLRFAFSPIWLNHLAATGGRLAASAVAQICATVLRDAEMLFAFSPLLLHRPEIALRPSDMTRINRQRHRRNEPPLLDHAEVSLQLGSAGLVSGRCFASGRSARLHFVRGHMVHRGAATFWRRSHLRGSGLNAAMSRTVTVGFGHNGSAASALRRSRTSRDVYPI